MRKISSSNILDFAVIVALVIILASLCYAFVSSAATEFNPETQTIYGKAGVYTDKPIVVNGKTYISTDTIKSEFGTEVTYNAAANTLDFGTHGSEVVSIIFSVIVTTYIIVILLIFITE